MERTDRIKRKSHRGRRSPDRHREDQSHRRDRRSEDRHRESQFNRRNRRSPDRQREDQFNRRDRRSPDRNRENQFNRRDRKSPDRHREDQFNRRNRRSPDRPREDQFNRRDKTEENKRDSTQEKKSNIEEKGKSAQRQEKKSDRNGENEADRTEQEMKKKANNGVETTNKRKELSQDGQFPSHSKAHKGSNDRGEPKTLDEGLAATRKRAKLVSVKEDSKAEKIQIAAATASADLEDQALGLEPINEQVPRQSECRRTQNDWYKATIRNNIKTAKDIWKNMKDRYGKTKKKRLPRQPEHRRDKGIAAEQQSNDFITFIDNNQLTSKSKIITTVIRIEPSPCRPSKCQCNEDFSPQKWLYNEDSAEDVIRYIEEQKNIYKRKRNDYLEMEIKRLQNRNGETTQQEFDSNNEHIITVCEHIDLDPSSRENIKNILKEVLDRTDKKWSVIGCDASIYYSASKLIKKDKELQKIMLLPGLGHYEQNIRKVMFRLMGDVGFYQLADIIKGTTTPRSHYYRPKYAHDAWNIIQTFLDATLKELLSPYVTEQRQYSADDLEKYIEESKNVNFKFIAKFTLEYVLAFYLFRTAMNENDHEVLIASKCQAADLFYGPNMWMYRYNELRDNITRYKLKDKEVKDFLERNESIRMPNKKYKREGGDSVLEYVNKKITNRMNQKRQPTKDDWKRECMNTNIELRNYRTEIFRRSDSRFNDEFDIHVPENVGKWLQYLLNQKSTHLKHEVEDNVHRSFTEKELDEGLPDFFSALKRNRRMFIRNILSDTKFKLKEVLLKKRENLGSMDASLRKKHRCPIARCKRRLSTKWHLKRHIKCVHFHDMKRHFCPYCDTSFNERGDLRTHLKLHTDRPHRCLECGKSFTREAQLKRHRTTHAIGISTKTVGKQTDMSVAEPDEKVVAQKRQVAKPAIKTLALVHRKIRPYICQYCKDEFNRQAFLNVHYMKMHNGERPFKCSVADCEESFRQPSSLYSHRKVHKRPDEFAKEIDTRISDTSGEANEYAVVQKGHFSKPSVTFDCTEPNCTGKFTTRPHLKTHINDVHHNIRNYPCPHCKSTFKQRAHLTTHIRTHTGERPYKCDVEGCGKSFKQSSTRKGHIKRVHREHVKSRAVENRLNSPQL